MAAAHVVVSKEEEKEEEKLYEHVRPTKLATHARSMREAGITLLFASGILSLFFFLSPALEQPVSTAVTIAPSTAPNAFAHVPLEAKAVIVYDLVTGETLYAKMLTHNSPRFAYEASNRLCRTYRTFARTPITIPASVVSIDGPRTFL